MEMNDRYVIKKNIYLKDVIYIYTLFSRVTFIIPARITLAFHHTLLCISRSSRAARKIRLSTANESTGVPIDYSEPAKFSEHAVSPRQTAPKIPTAIDAPIRAYEKVRVAKRTESFIATSKFCEKKKSIRIFSTSRSKSLNLLL